jgi:hypothetical protein
MGVIVATVVPNADQMFTIVGNVIESFLDNVKATQGQVNRVPEPKDVDFVTMWPINNPRLATTVDTYVDCVFTGSIAGDVLTVTAVNPAFSGLITPRAAVFGTGVTVGTRVIAQLSGTTGGIGTYSLTGAQTVGSRTMAAGVKQLMESTEAVMQVDVHGPNAWDNAQTIANVFRDGSGVNAFNLEWEALFNNYDYLLSPLYCEDPRQLPFTNDQDQVEDRWTIIMHIQAKQTITLPQQFADALAVTPINVDTYPI